MLQIILDWLTDSTGFMPHGFCLLWQPGLIWVYTLSDLGIALAYFSIPLTLIVFARRRPDLGFRSTLWLFVSFILLCGTTHLLDVVTTWLPAYALAATVKVATAVISIITAFALWQLLPHALALPSHAQLNAANEALQMSEARYRAAFEYAPLPLHTLSPDGIITGVSRSWQKLLGYFADEVVGRPINDFRMDIAGTWVDADWNALTAEGEVHDLERRFRRRDGTIIDVLLSARLEPRNGEAASIVCGLIDVTKRRQVEAALRESEERLHQSQKMEAIGQLTGGIAHDFNNMLQTIKSGLELATKRITAGHADEAGRFISMAQKAADSAAALTNRMLAFARRQVLQPTLIEPGKLLHGMTPLIQSAVGPTINLNMDLQDGWMTACDANQLESAILNLVLNARDAMPNGGDLWIVTGDRTLNTADLVGHDDVAPGDFIEIAVSDTGTGMTPEVLRRAFEPFYTTRPLGGGTGLGLSQVYGFVRQSGGFVLLESMPGDGTTVRLYLPRRDRSTATADRETAASGSQPDDIKTAERRAVVLVVEDEERTREMIVSILAEHGHDVMEAADGPSGLRILQSAARVDLLLTDVGLPGLNGRQLADAARERRPHLPVLFITGYAGTALNDNELTAGMQVLRKPFNFEALTAHVNQMIRGR